mgnify:CR=1 FL=1
MVDAVGRSIIVLSQNDKNLILGDNNKAVQENSAY